MPEQKLTFNIIYYPAFQNVRSIMEELHILLTPNKEQKKVFPNVLVIGFRNGMSLKDYLVKATLPKLNKSGRCEPCGKKTCLVCDSISTTTTFTAEACQKTFKIHNCPSTLIWACGGYFFSPCWFSFNNSETVKSVNLAFCSI